MKESLIVVGAVIGGLMAWLHLREKNPTQGPRAGDENKVWWKRLIGR
jgi:hypothetical protein